MNALHQNEEGTRQWFGHLYHWSREGGRLHAVSGMAPRDRCETSGCPGHRDHPGECARPRTAL